MDKVQLLVVQWLMEFEMANSSGMGKCILKLYILNCIIIHHRVQVTNKDCKRSKDVRGGYKVCIEELQCIGQKMNPPAPILHKDQIFAYTFVAEFDLLKHSYSHADITDKPWTVPENQEVAAKYFKMLHAKEELKFLNVEVHWLQTWIQDEN